MCGIFGISGHKDAGRLAYLGLYALQHRGEESAGIVTYDNKKLRSHIGMGLVKDVFDERAIKSLKGNIAVGHVRYSTTGSSLSKNAQPFCVSHKKRHMVIAHNGNLVNIAELRDIMEEKGSIFQSTMDSEIIAHLLADAGEKDLKGSIPGVLSKLEGAYALVLMLNDILIGARDPNGFRPLCIGKLDGAYVLASETSALDLIEAEYIREVEPGEIVFITPKGVESVKQISKNKQSLCIFEYIYFARPDSNIFGKNVYMTRKRLGSRLASECREKCDLVMPIPDSGNYAALGFAQKAKTPYEIGLVRNHYIGRTFIQPSQFIRDFKVKVKLNPIKDVVKGRRIMIIEDSIVRGTTSRLRVKVLRKAGARQIYMCVSCPPLKFPCFYGIDFHTKKELAANNRSIKQIKDYIGLDGLMYLSLEGMLNAMPWPRNIFCTACFTGKYPTAVPKRLSKNILEKGR